ncbi:hypothetical protein N5P37_011766 [Trichoderma harzianum]|uniref:Uncharacterized protein n=1 Tax=Trichoderma harzianum CBS 226.95 TaxID=983964 RepID=A0A2T3ZRP1_TRIHA|nr:hypothetical protein M431DRAFT_11712 [Trichoderma harzianum CBS 226.95]KAK0755687.1 hypothetical protein N5P37_011766 [Trichoderma harzianum]PKK42218.1 hypothetical protein CI102_15314 [Trichoderma harzianum]PTB47480.1 hypothetical protein M431DRAFT_11712 [Trichoderma harzianum CBS 226.95]
MASSSVNRDLKPAGSQDTLTGEIQSEESEAERDVHRDANNDNQREEIEPKDNVLQLPAATTHDADTTLDTTLTHEREPTPWYKRANPLLWNIPPIPKERTVSREHQASFFSKVSFAWMTPLMTTGYRRQLDKQDIWLINPDRASERLICQVKNAFHRRVRNKQQNPLFWALHETFMFEFWLGGLCSLVASVLQVFTPFTLRYLIQFATDAYNAQLSHTTPPVVGQGIGLVVGVTIMQLLQSTCTSHYIYRGMLIGGQTRSVLVGLIYEKSMVISGRARAGGSKEAQMHKAGEKEDEKNGAGWSNGRITSLMSVDTSRVEQPLTSFHMIWTSPITCLITLALLIVNLSYSALAGFGLLVISVPLLTRAMRNLLHRRHAINMITDKRVSLTQEILQSIRFVKYFGWEKAFVDRLEEIRSREISSIQTLLAIRDSINAVSMSMPIFASMLSFITFSLTHSNLAPAEVFSSLALFNSLRMPLNLLPQILGQTIDAWSSLQRIQHFLLEEEQEENFIYIPDEKLAIELVGASFTWEGTPNQDPDNSVESNGAAKTKKDVEKVDEKKEISQHSSSEESSVDTVLEEREPFKLQDLSFQVGRDELIAVIGTVGCGKSSLLSALAGDMRKTNGDLIFGASKAFCSQYPWIQNTTLQKNITFGKEMDKQWYKDTIRACALQTDLDMLPNGDQTEIGERGITISGGQKQRLNIARAIYSNADIILMDDPLSAVDAHVGRHIFDNAILGLLKNKCRILATHQLWVLSRCDRIVWLDSGKIHAIDTFENLMRDHKGFRTLMETTDVEKKREEGKEEANGKQPSPTESVKAREDNENLKGALMQQEERPESSVPWGVYGAYIRASGTILNGPLIFFILVLAQGANIATSLWLSYWTSNKFNLSTGQYIGIYAGLGAFQALLVFLFSVSLSIMGTSSSKVMLREAVFRVLRAPVSFFDTTPLGRITNRFSQDINVMDNNLTDSLRLFFLTLGTVTAVFALIVTYFHFFAIVLGPMYILCILAALYYRASARQVKQFESTLRSTVFAKFGEGLTGVACIRAYGVQNQFVQELQRAMDDMNSAYYLTFSNQRWLATRLDLIGNLLVFIIGILVVTSRFGINPSISGLVLSYILTIVQMLQFAIRLLAEVENSMNAVERLHYYGNMLEEEAPLQTVDVRKSWPERGEIIFENVQMRYRPNLPLVLQGFSAHIKGGERIGIIGRTGAGKSSIMGTLFRLVEISKGSIIIDGINTATIGLYDLRSRLTIIPQDPTLFCGTVRTNLDPFNEHNSTELWSALRQAGLVSTDADGEGCKTGQIRLDSIVEEDGLNFSLGQRQLMALARALIRGSQIIVCDEATSSVDMETDDMIQKAMAVGFRGKTVLCIAHRLRTIVGYDRICVMDAGRIAELDTPLELWKKGGIFKSMCDRSGIRMRDIQSAREELERLSGPGAI